MTSISALYTCFCPLLLNSHSVAPRGPFVHRKAKSLFHMYSRRGSDFSQCHSGDPLTPAYCRNPICCSFSCPLPLSLASLKTNGSLPFPAPQLFSPLVHSSKPHICHFPSSYADYFLNPQIYFLVVQNDLMLSSSV